MPSAVSAPEEDEDAVSLRLAINFELCEIKESDETVPSVSSGPGEDDGTESVVSAFDFEGFVETETRLRKQCNESVQSVISFS